MHICLAHPKLISISISSPAAPCCSNYRLPNQKQVFLWNKAQIALEKHPSSSTPASAEEMQAGAGTQTSSPSTSSVKNHGNQLKITDLPSPRGSQSLHKARTAHEVHTAGSFILKISNSYRYFLQQNLSTFHQQPPGISWEVQTSPTISTRHSCVLLSQTFPSKKRGCFHSQRWHLIVASSTTESKHPKVVFFLLKNKLKKCITLSNRSPRKSWFQIKVSPSSSEDNINTT